MNEPRRLAIVTLVALAFVALPAAAGPLAQLFADQVHLRGSEHSVVVRALDAEGRAVPGLEATLRVQRDGEPVGAIDVHSPFEDHETITVGVVVDGELLSADSPDRGPVLEMLRSLASGLDEGDRVRVLSAGPAVKQREWRAGDLREDVEAVRELRQDGEPRVRDAIHAGLVAVARDNAGPVRVLLVVTRGRDGDSRHNAAQLAVGAMRGAGITSVEVWRLGGGGDEGVASQLERLASGTGGRLLREAPAALTVATDVLSLARRYEIRFQAERGRDGSETHRVAVLASSEGRDLEHSLSYTDDGASDPAWWASPLVWLVLVGSLGLLALLLWLLRPRQVALLVVKGGDGDGQWYEIFALPTRIGARQDNDILMVGPTISGLHCLLERDGRDVVLVDQRSEHGTFVNEQRVHRHVLRDDDLIRLGNDVELYFEAR